MDNFTGHAFVLIFSSNCSADSQSLEHDSNRQSLSACNAFATKGVLLFETSNRLNLYAKVSQLYRIFNVTFVVVVSCQRALTLLKFVVLLPTPLVASQCLGYTKETREKRSALASITRNNTCFLAEYLTRVGCDYQQQ